MVIWISPYWHIYFLEHSIEKDGGVPLSVAIRSQSGQVPPQGYYITLSVFFSDVMQYPYCLLLAHFMLLVSVVHQLVLIGICFVARKVHSSLACIWLYHRYGERTWLCKVLTTVVSYLLVGQKSWHSFFLVYIPYGLFFLLIFMCFLNLLFSFTALQVALFF